MKFPSLAVADNVAITSSGSGTYYLPIVGVLSSNVTGVEYCPIRMPKAGVLSDPRFVITSNAALGDHTLTLLVNGVVKATQVIAAGVSGVFTPAWSVPVVAGDLVQYRLVRVGNSGALAFASAQINFTADDGTTTGWVVADTKNSVVASSGTYWIGVSSVHFSIWGTASSWANLSLKGENVPWATTATVIGINVPWWFRTTPGANTISLAKSGGSPVLTVTLPAGSPTRVYASGSVALAPGDDLGYYCDWTNKGSDNPRVGIIQMDVVWGDDYELATPSVATSTGAFGAPGTDNPKPMGGFARINPQLPLQGVQLRVPEDAVLRDMRLALYLAPRTADWPTFVQKNGADTAITVTSPAGSSGTYIASDLTHSVALVAGDLLNYADRVPAGTGPNDTAIGIRQAIIRVTKAPPPSQDALGEGPIGTVRLYAPAGTGGIGTVASGPIGTVTLSPPAGGPVQSALASGPIGTITISPPRITIVRDTQHGVYVPVDTAVDERLSQFGALIPGQVQVNIRNCQMGLLVIAKGGETPLKPDPLKMQDGGRQPLLVQRLVNMYVETTPEGPVASKRVGRPGLAVSREFGGGAVRATFLHKGFRYTVAGELVWRDAVNIGVVPKDGPVRWAISDEEVVIMAGKRAYYVTLNDVTRIMDPDLPEIRDVTFLAGRFIYFDADNSGFYRYSDVNDARSIDGLAFASAEADPDAIIGGVRNGESMVIFGEKTVEFHYPTTDPASPFQRSQGRTYDIGCRAIQTVQPLDNTLAFVGSDRLVYFVGQVPLRVSTSAIEDELRRQTQEEFEANTAFTITFGGHYFYVLNIVGRGTWALQASTKLWAEWKSWGMDRFRVSVSDGEGFMGCAFTGKIMYFDGSLFTDVGEPLERICSTWQGLKSGHMRNFMLALHTQQGVGLLGDGYGSDPHVEMRFSDHLGRNWSNWLEASLGAHGVRGKEALAQWTNLGTFPSPGRAFEFRCTDPVEFTPFMVSINEWRP